MSGNSEETLATLRSLWRTLAPADIHFAGESEEQRKALTLAEEALSLAREAVRVSGKLVAGAGPTESVEGLRERVRDLARALRASIRYQQERGLLRGR